jgi:hypothetical protein
MNMNQAAGWDAQEVHKGAIRLLRLRSKHDEGCGEAMSQKALRISQSLSIGPMPVKPEC